MIVSEIRAPVTNVNEKMTGVQSSVGFEGVYAMQDRHGQVQALAQMKRRTSRMDRGYRDIVAGVSTGPDPQSTTDAQNSAVAGPKVGGRTSRDKTGISRHKSRSERVSKR